MNFGRLELTGEEARFREEVRRLLTEHLTPEVRAEVERTGSKWSQGLCTALGERGWILPERSVKEGGAALTRRQADILELELQRAEAPLLALDTTTLTVPAIEEFGSADLVSELLPRVARGQALICLGYTEPDSGSDIAAAKTRAVRDGDEWVINGSKMYTTEAHHCQYVFLLTRTNTDVPKHKGLTTFLVPLDVDGVEIGPIQTVGGERTNVVYLTDVRISDRYRLGDVDTGWQVLMAPLAAEHGDGPRSDIGFLSAQGRIPIMTLQKALDSAVRWATRDGDRPAAIRDPVVRDRLARVAIELEAALCCEDPMGRVYASSACIRGCVELLSLVGPDSVIEGGEEGAIDGGWLEVAHRIAQGTSIYGGTVEIFKNTIAQHVLGLPRQLPPSR